VAFLRRRFRTQSSSHAAVARRALEEAHAAAERKEGALVASAVERAIYTTVEDRLGLKARAVMRNRLAAELEQSGAERALATETVTVLEACDGLRFGGRGDESPEVVAKARSIVSRMARASTSAESRRAP
jgi:hypothetical protein